MNQEQLEAAYKLLNLMDSDAVAQVDTELFGSWFNSCLTTSLKHWRTGDEPPCAGQLQQEPTHYRTVTAELITTSAVTAEMLPPNIKNANQYPTDSPVCFPYKRSGTFIKVPGKTTSVL